MAGTWATALLEARVTTTPPVGAGFVSVTVPVLLAPPVTELGEDEMERITTEEPMPNPQLTVAEL